MTNHFDLKKTRAEVAHWMLPATGQCVHRPWFEPVCWTLLKQDDGSSTPAERSLARFRGAIAWIFRVARYVP